MKKINFVKKFPIFGAVAAVFCIIGFLSIALLPFGVNWFNLDVDFIGGTTLQYNFNKELTKAELDDIANVVISIAPDSSPAVQALSQGNDINGAVIKAKELKPDVSAQITNALAEKYNITIDSSATSDESKFLIGEDTVEPVMSADIRDAAIISAILAVILMLIYIGIRFDFKSGLAAIIALIHDLLVMISFYVILQIPLNMTFIAAALTILGYSINATIVIFDRIRENRKMLRKATFGDIVDTSIKQTVTRSVNTTITTLITIVMLIILGVDSVRDFAIPIAIGVVAGLYSSVCISGPIWSRFMGVTKKQ